MRTFLFAASAVLVVSAAAPVAADPALNHPCGGPSQSLVLQSGGSAPPLNDAAAFAAWYDEDANADRLLCLREALLDPACPADAPLRSGAHCYRELIPGRDESGAVITIGSSQASNQRNRAGQGGGQTGGDGATVGGGTQSDRDGQGAGRSTGASAEEIFRELERGGASPSRDRAERRGGAAGRTAEDRRADLVARSLDQCVGCSLLVVLQFGVDYATAFIVPWLSFNALTLAGVLFTIGGTIGILRLWFTDWQPVDVARSTAAYLGYALIASTLLTQPWIMLGGAPVAIDGGGIDGVRESLRTAAEGQTGFGLTWIQLAMLGLSAEVMAIGRDAFAELESIGLSSPYLFYTHDPGEAEITRYIGAEASAIYSKMNGLAQEKARALVTLWYYGEQTVWRIVQTLGANISFGGILSGDALASLVLVVIYGLVLVVYAIFVVVSLFTFAIVGNIYPLLILGLFFKRTRGWLMNGIFTAAASGFAVFIATIVLAISSLSLGLVQAGLNTEDVSQDFLSSAIPLSSLSSPIFWAALITGVLTVYFLMKSPSYVREIFKFSDSTDGNALRGEMRTLGAAVKSLGGVKAAALGVAGVPGAPGVAAAAGGGGLRAAAASVLGIKR